MVYATPESFMFSWLLSPNDVWLFVSSVLDVSGLEAGRNDEGRIGNRVSGSQMWGGRRGRGGVVNGD